MAAVAKRGDKMFLFFDAHLFKINIDLPELYFVTVLAHTNQSKLAS
jgi:hypothetical protein